MNSRVLELIKAPQSITVDDLSILESESKKMPYAQSLRAILLYGIHLYQPESYKENLTKTAAFTTDKKILYQFINSEKNKILESASTQKQTEQNTDNQKTKQQLVFENQHQINTVEQINSDEKQNAVEENDSITNEPENNHESVLVKKDDDSFESAKIISDDPSIPEVHQTTSTTENNSQNTDNQEINPISKTQSVSNFEEAKTEITLEQNNENETTVEHSSDLSFNGIEDFLPNIRFSVPKNHSDYLNPQKQEIKKPEEPPIFEPKTESKTTPSFEDEKELVMENPDGISFENIQSFEIVSQDSLSIVIPENTDSNEESVTPTTEKNDSDWKPMSVSSHVPDALIATKPELNLSNVEQPKLEISNPTEKPLSENKPEIVEHTEQKTEQDRPVFNVSFFGNDVSILEENQEISSKKKIDLAKESNVGTFINTWQNWLKIDRTPKVETVVEEEKPNVKEKIIDNFIEKNPKISQLKDEQSFVVREKKEDISHLMTDTLAKLYTEQKLYSKAIKAYETLSGKNPHKKDFYHQKIEEIKEMRKS